MSDIVRKVTECYLGGTNDNRYQIRVPSLGMPRAAFFVLSRATGYGTVGVGDEAFISTGMWAESGNQNCASFVTGDNGSTQQVRGVYLEGKVGTVIESTSTTLFRQIEVTDARLDELILTYTGSDLSRYILVAEIWTGDDLEGKVDVRTVTLTGGVGVAEVVTGVGFEAKLLKCHSTSRANGASATTQGAWSYGLATWQTPTITQRSTSWSADAAASTAALLHRLSGARVVHLQNPAGTSANWGAELTAVGADGYSLTHRGTTTGSEILGVLAMDTGDLDLKLETISTPTGAPPVTVNYTSAAFQVAGVELLPSLAEIIDTNYTTSPNAEYAGISLWDADHAANGSLRAEDGVSATSQLRASVIAKKPVYVQQGSGTVLLEADFVSLNSDGDSLNWTTTNATARLAAKLSIGAPAAVPGRDHLDSHIRHSIGTVTDWWDVTNPPKHTGLRGMSNWQQYPSGAILNAQIDYFTGRNQLPVFVFPPGDYLIEEQVEFDNIEGLLLLGAGSYRNVDPGSVKQAGVRLRWIGGTTGPAFVFDRTPGLCSNGIIYSAGDVALDVLVQWEQGTGGTGQLFGEFKGGGFMSENNSGPIILFRAKQSSGTSADVAFDHCQWRTLPTTGNIDYGSTGFEATSQWGVNWHFKHCEFGRLGTAIHQNGGGRTVVDQAIINTLHTFFKDSTPSANHAGVSLRNLHVDGGAGDQYRKKLVHCVSDTGSYGPIDLVNTTINLPLSTGDQYKPLDDVESLGGTSYRVRWNAPSGANNKLRMAVGDEIMFVAAASRNTMKARAIITSIINFDNEYVVTELEGSLSGLDASGVEGTADEATWGEPIIDIAGRTQFAWLGGDMWGTTLFDKNRLVRMRKSSGGGFNQIPYALLERLTLEGSNAVDLPKTYLNLIGSPPPQYRFRDCGRQDKITRFNISNIPPYTRVHTADPTANDDADAGYNLFDTWANSTTGNEFVLTDTTPGAAVWDAGGADGADGADGRTVLNGTGAPSAGLGVDGDFYIDTAANDIYGPKTGGAWGTATSLQGAPGDPGNDGADGNTILNGTGAPGDGTGVDGDFYIDTNSAEYFMYGPKAGGTWTGATIKRLKGEQGPAGTGATVGTFLGAWDDTTSYVIDDVVTHEGGTYIAVANNLNSEPPSANWDALIPPLEEGVTGVARNRQWHIDRGTTAKVVIKEPDEDGPFAASFLNMLDRNGTEFIVSVISITPGASLTSLTVDLPAAAIINGPWIEFDISGGVGEPETEGEIEIHIQTNRTPVVVGTVKLKVREKQPPAK